MDKEPLKPFSEVEIQAVQLPQWEHIAVGTAAAFKASAAGIAAAAPFALAELGMFGQQAQGGLRSIEDKLPNLGNINGGVVPLVTGLAVAAISIPFFHAQSQHKAKQDRLEALQDIDLNDSNTRTLLQDTDAIKWEAIKAGAILGLVGGALQCGEILFEAPVMMKHFKDTDASHALPHRVIETIQKAPIMSTLLGGTALATLGVSVYGYVSTKDILDTKREELLDTSLPQSAPLPSEHTSRLIEKRGQSLKDAPETSFMR
jgi:hypothetical protein